MGRLAEIVPRLSTYWDGLKTHPLRWEEAGFGWKRIHFSLYLEIISVSTQHNQMAPQGRKAILSHAFSPDPVLSVVRPWVTQSLSCSYFLCNKNTTAVPKLERSTKGTCSQLKKQGLRFLRFCGRPLGLSLSELMFIYSLLISQFVVSASRSSRLESISIMCWSRGTLVGNCAQLSIVLTPHDRTVYLVTWSPPIPQYG